MHSNQRYPLASNQDVEGKTPLHVAVLNNQVERVRELLRNYSKDNEIRDRNNKYPYQYAIDNGNMEILVLFSNYYLKYKVEVVLTQNEFEDKVRKWKDIKNTILPFSMVMGACAVREMKAFFAAQPEDDKVTPVAFVASFIAPLIASATLLLGSIGCATYIRHLRKSKPQQKLLGQINERLNEIDSKILGVAVLNNQVEKVQELLQNYSEDSEIKDKNNKYPYQYAIDNGNREILALFSHYYEERKAEVERTVRKLEDKVDMWNHVKKVNMIISICINTLCPLYVGITSLVAESKTDMLKNSLSSFIFPTFYKTFQDVLDVEEKRLNTDSKIIETLLDYEQQKCENLTDEAKREYIKGTGVIKDLLNQVENDTLELSKVTKWVEDEMREVNVYDGSVGKAYRDHIRILEEFKDHHQTAIAVLSIAVSLTSLFYNAIEVVHSYYSRKCTSQHKLLQYVNEKLNEISHKINELEMEDRLNRRVEEMLSGIRQRVAEMEMKLGNLQSSTKASSNVESGESQLNAAIQEIHTNMESVEVESAFASKSTEHK